MASLTIRKLDEAIKDDLRLRAARNGRSVEDEVRVILREAVNGVRARPAAAAAAAQPPRPVAQSCRPATAARHPDHRRRHRRL